MLHSNKEVGYSDKAKLDSRQKWDRAKTLVCHEGKVLLISTTKAVSLLYLKLILFRVYTDVVHDVSLRTASASHMQS